MKNDKTSHSKNFNQASHLKVWKDFPLDFKVNKVINIILLDSRAFLWAQTGTATLKLFI